MLARVRDLLDNDKVKHFVYGLAMTGMLVPFGWSVAATFVGAVALLKEYVDLKVTGKFSPSDAGVTMFSVVFLYTWYELIERLSTYM